MVAVALRHLVKVEEAFVWLQLEMEGVYPRLQVRETVWDHQVMVMEHASQKEMGPALPSQISVPVPEKHSPRKSRLPSACRCCGCALAT